MSNTGIMFFISWLICGCCIESALDNRRVFFVAVIALIVAVVSGLRLIEETLIE